MHEINYNAEKEMCDCFKRKCNHTHKEDKSKLKVKGSIKVKHALFVASQRFKNLVPYKKDHIEVLKPRR